MRQVYVGADRLTVDALDKGLDGIIGGGGSSALAATFVGIYDAHKAGDRSRAGDLQSQLNAWCAQHFDPWIFFLLQA